ncbi:EI24 domain-containing protein [Kiloniella laminariae]|uniref:EI24 domain-containing protein n=1 Tax=Kiloniella laminariae TaxID=454162 RepID=A0ABT4LIP1_9PROT|nr:EI24 domain-containing protein [Kiloniella laminariae]MCZ4280969.1 EI24 domain-containing protein [Kiloniella laminariae]
MFSDLSKAFGQTGDPAFRRVFFISAAASLVVFALLWIAAGYAVGLLDDQIVQWSESGGWFTSILVWGAELISWLGVVVLSFLLFPSVMLVIIPFFLEDIARAVESKHYPQLDAGREPPLGETIWGSLSFLGITLLVNILALPLYLLPGVNLILFYVINGYLLGREYFEMVALRRFALAEVKTLRRKYRGRVVLAGFVLAFLLTVPVLNIVMPIWATAFMLHRFENFRQLEA